MSMLQEVSKCFRKLVTVMFQEVGKCFRKSVTAVCMCVKCVFVCVGEEERGFPRHCLRIGCVYQRTKPSHQTLCLVSHVSLCLSGCEGKPPKVVFHYYTFCCVFQIVKPSYPHQYQSVKCFIVFFCH